MIGLKQTRGIKKHYSEGGKKIRGCRGLLGRVIVFHNSLEWKIGGRREESRKNAALVRHLQHNHATPLEVAVMNGDFIQFFFLHL